MWRGLMHGVVVASSLGSERALPRIVIERLAWSWRTSDACPMHIWVTGVVSEYWPVGCAATHHAPAPTRKITRTAAGTRQPGRVRRVRAARALGARTFASWAFASRTISPVACFG